jgi:hypothetical protein
VRWRCRSGLFRILHDRPQEVVPLQRLRSLLDQGSIHMDETYILTSLPGRASLRLTFDLTVQIPIIGGLLERLWAGPATRRGCEASLQGLRRHCEAHS